MKHVKIPHKIHEKIPVIQIQYALSMPNNEVVGRLIRVWAWAAVHAKDRTTKMPMSGIDEIAGAEGFAAAMQAAGLLQENDGALRILDCP
jgi:hypothetical protein